MTELRQDPLTLDWVIIAPERAQRPSQVPPPAGHGPAAPAEDCPFCAGREAMTAPAVYEHRANGAWTVRVVPNRYPALRVEESTDRRTEDGRFLRMGGVGAHEVVVESPDHGRSIDALPDGQVCEIVNALLARYHDLRRDRRFASIQIFKNSGIFGGSTLEHPHCQIIATPVVPSELRRRQAAAVRHRDELGRNLYRDVVDDELKAGKRVVLRTDRFAVFHPWASRAPFETWIVPMVDQASFGELHGDAVPEFASVLRRTLAVVIQSVGHRNYNLMVHTAPFEDESKGGFLWHVVLLPRHAVPAGFETGSGIYINVARPEETAAHLRDRIS